MVDALLRPGFPLERRASPAVGLGVRDIAAIDRMLRLGASSDMVQRYFGLTHQEVAL